MASFLLLTPSCKQAILQHMHDIRIYGINVHVCPSQDNYERPESSEYVGGVKTVGHEKFVHALND